MPSPQKKCNLKRVRKLLQETIQDSWVVTNSALNEWVQSCEGVEDDVTGVLVQCSAARDDGLRILAVQQLSEMGWSASGRRAEIVPALLERIDDRNGRVLSIVSEQLPRVIKACTGQDNAVLDVLLAACGNSENASKRATAFEMLRLAFGRFPERADDIITAVIRGCGDGHPEVRRQAIDQVSDLAKARPERAPEIQDVLMQVLKNCNSTMYLHASSELEKIDAVTPNRAEEIARKLFEKYESWNGYVNLSVMKILARSVHLWPEKANMIVESLMLWLKTGGYHTQGEALGSLMDLMKWCPARRIEIADAVLHRLGYGVCKDAAEHDLQSATLCLASKAVKGCPERANEIVEVLTVITRGRDAHNRGLALRALSESIATDLQRIDAVLDALIYACRSSDEDERNHAVDQISSGTEAYSDISRDIIEAVLKGCESESANLRSSVIQQLAAKARSSPDRAAEIVEVLFQLSNSEDTIKRVRAMESLAQTATLCPQKSALIVARLFHGCVDDHPHACDAAKESLVKALPLRPDIAVKILGRMIRHCSEKEDIT